MYGCDNLFIIIISGCWSIPEFKYLGHLLDRKRMEDAQHSRKTAGTIKSFENAKDRVLRGLVSRGYVVNVLR